MTARTTAAVAIFASTLPSISSQSVHLFAPSFLDIEPPCRRARLEPFRQSIRDSCRSDAALCRPAPPLELQRLVEEPRLSIEEVFDDMMSHSLRLFDAMLAEDARRQQEAERAAEDALQAMLASLFSRGAGEEAGFPPAKEIELNENLSPAAPESDEHTALRTRLARRLSEYVDVFYHPDGSVFIQSSSVPDGYNLSWLSGMESPLDSCIYSRYLNGDLEAACEDSVTMYMVAEQTSGLTYSQMMKAKHHQEETRALDQIAPAIQSHITQYYASFAGLTAVYALVALVGLCSGLIDMYTFAVGIVISLCVAVFGFWTLLVILPASFLADRVFRSDNEEESDVDSAHDYVKLDDNDDGETTRQAETLVFVGVPVQVV